MEKFSKIQNKKESSEDTKGKVTYETNFWKSISYNSWEFIDENDSVCIIPIFVKENKIFLRMEVIPPFEYKDGQEFHLTCISGTIEEGEKPENCVIRELREEAGLLLRDSVKIEIFDTFYKSKGHTSRFHLCILPLSLYDYDEVIASGDGSETEALSKTVSVDIKNIDRLSPSDVITRLMILEVKKYMNIQ